MSSISKLFAKYNPTFDLLPTTDKKLININTVKYMFGFISSHDYIKSSMMGTGLAPKFNDSIPTKSAISTNGYLLKNLKLAVWNQYCLGSFDHKLEECDAKIVVASLQDQDFVNYLAGLRAEGFKAVSLRSFDVHLANSYKAIFPWLLGYTKKHCSWITNSFALETHDIATELFERGYSAALMLYPRINSYDHMLNIMRLSIRNYVTNLHLKYSTDSRNPLIKEEVSHQTSECTVLSYDASGSIHKSVVVESKSVSVYSFNTKTISMHSMHDDSGADIDVDTALMVAGAVDLEDDNSFDALNNYQQYTNMKRAVATFADIYEYKLDSDELINIVQGEVSESFTNYVTSRFKTSCSINEFIDNNNHMILDHYCQYAGISPAHQIEFKQYLRNCFS